MKAHQHKYRHEVDRVCDCGKGIEDVFHFLHQCSVYNNLYVKYWMIQYRKSGMRWELNIVWILLYRSTLLHLQTTDYRTKNASGFCQLRLISIKTLPDAYDIVRTITTKCSKYKYIYCCGNINKVYMALLHLNWYIANCSASPTSSKIICEKTTSVLTCRCE